MYNMSKREPQNKRFVFLDMEQELKALWVGLVDNANSDVLSKSEGVNA